MQDTIAKSGNVWQSEGEIVVPKHVSEPVLPRGFHAPGPVKASAAKVPTGKSGQDSLAKARTDSMIIARNDSLAHEHSGFGIVLTAPYDTRTATATMRQDALSESEPPQIKGHGLSWIFAALALLFCAVCLKFKNNPRYIRTLLADLRDVRTRHNLFDDTVKETSFLFLLNATWICSAGVLLWELVRLRAGNPVLNSLTVPDRPLPGIGMCVAVVAIYVVLLILAYYIVGNVFTDSKLTRMWVKGASASFGLQAFLFFPLSLLVLCYPSWSAIILLVAAATLLIGKILFIYKGFRIFFSQMSSWLLFLYYLCSLEIVPLILTYLAALAACSEWL